jgi:hypothetical protein
VRLNSDPLAINLKTGFSNREFFSRGSDIPLMLIKRILHYPYFFLRIRSSELIRLRYKCETVNALLFLEGSVFQLVFSESQGFYYLHLAWKKIIFVLISKKLDYDPFPVFSN